MELWVVRHGETEWNRDRRIQGQLDPGLSSIGMEQADGAAEALADVTFARILCSDLRRARETVTPIARGRGVAIELRRALRERHFGALQGLTWAEARTQHPEAVRSREVNAKNAPELNIEDRESEFRKRILAAIRELAEQGPQGPEPTLIVTHGGVVRILLEEAEGKEKMFMIPNCAIYRFDTDGQRLCLSGRGRKPASTT